MNRERAKELLPIITAFANAEPIETKVAYLDGWRDVTSPLWYDDAEYRIKPKPSYRPFTMDEFKPHKNRWVRTKIGIIAYHIMGYSLTAVHIGRERPVEYIELYARYIFDDDGTPCGVEIK